MNLKIAKQVKVVSNQQKASNKEEEVRREPQVSSCFVHNLESKGEGLLPYVCKDLAHGDVFLHYLYEEVDCEEIVSEKSVVTFVPSERQIVDQFLFQFGEDLEMGDASSPLLQFDEGQEMGDSSSGLELVSGSGGGYNIANSWEAMSNQDEFFKDKEGLLKGSETSTIILESKEEEEEDFEAARADSIDNSQQVNAVTSQEQRGRGSDKECLKLAVIAVVQQDFQVIVFPKEDAPSFQNKGEGLLPQVCDLAHNNVLTSLMDKGDDACTFTRSLCMEDDFEVVNVKQEMTLTPSDRQGSVPFVFGIGDDLEMGDSSGLEVVTGDLAESQEKVFMKAEECFDENLFIECHAVHSLWLFFIKGSVLRVQARFHSKSINAGASHPFLLQAHGEEETLVDGKANEDVFEDKDKDDWGFDEPKCVMDSNMQTNVGRAMVRVRAKLEELDSKKKEVPKQILGSFSTPKHDQCVVLLNDMDTTSRLWSVLQVFKEPFQRIGACLERIFELRQAHEYLCNILMGCKMHMHDWVVLDIGIKIWDPGKCEF